MPLVATRGAASAQGFGEFAKTGEAVYIESCFSTWLYTGNGSTQTITNGIELSTKGGLLWMKSRSQAAGHMTYDTASNATLRTDGVGANSGYYPTYISPTSSGFSLDASAGGGFNTNAVTYASWTFRKQPKFFDVVTWTGNGTTQAINHNLGSTPGCIIVKSTTTDSNWAVYHRGASSGFFYLNSTAAVDTGGTSDNHFGNNSVVVAPTSTQFTVGNSISVNSSGQTYVAYLFAHDAGGFGLTGTDNVISCGSVTGSQVVNLGYEPQWVLSKCAGSTGDWSIVDNMRGAPTPASGNTPYSNVLVPNTSDAETTSGTTGSAVIFNSTGFRLNPDTVVATTYIYIAIRRGPMKTPTTGTSVFQPFVNYTSIGNQVNGTMGPVDLGLQTQVPTPFSAATHFSVFDRLRGSQKLLATSVTNAEGSGNVFFDTNTGIRNESWFTNGGVGYNFQRAPGFFDVVCYTGTGVARTVSHNLSVAPELMIVKCRSAVRDWVVYSAAITANNFLYLYLTDASAAGSFWNSTSPTSSVFTVGDPARVNGSGATYVAYLFASCPGVSKVGSYTGTGALQTVNCGFTGGARFVLIKRTDSTGDWWVYDSARGITSGNDPYLFLNSTAAQVTNTNYVDTTSVGFQVTAAAPAGLNANGGTYIFLAVA
jgi:hypothetical protein